MSTWGNSGWGSGWGSGSRGGSSGGWGSSGMGGHETKEPEGQHIGSCTAENTWGNGGLFSKYYDEKCSGCRRDRSMQSWGSSNGSTGSKAIKIGALYLGKKSLFG